jgi:hypothetical protein
MKPFQFEHVHAWQGNAHIIVSIETTKTLEYFKTTDDAINWLYVNDHKDAARALNAYMKVNKE